MVNQGQNNSNLYRIRLYPIDTESNKVEWIAEIPDLPGCIGAGDTPEEALAMLKDAQRAWIAIAIEDNKPIPEPTKFFNGEYSGKFTLRLPRSLHRELAIQAEEEGVSLNQYILYLIGKGLSQSETSAASEQSKTYRIELKPDIFLKQIFLIWQRFGTPEYSTEAFERLGRRF